MSTTTDLYKHSLALLTDLYQLTMAYGYWKLGTRRQGGRLSPLVPQEPVRRRVQRRVRPAIRHRLSRRSPLRSGRRRLPRQRSPATTASRCSRQRFLDYLREMRFTCDVDAMPEGTVVFPHEPLVRVRGPILQCQILETPLLNMINFQTLIATKSSRICQAAKGEPVMEFGLRRAQGIDGGLAASPGRLRRRVRWRLRNLLAGKLFGIPVKGTHAHSWVMSFDTEMEAFEAYAKVMPNNCVFLVDTYNTLEGVRHAAKVGQEAEGGRPQDDRHPPRQRRPRLPQHRGPQDPRRSRPCRRQHPRQQRSRRADHRQPQGPGGEDHRLGRRHEAGDGVRPAGAGRRLQARCDPRRQAAGSTR